MEDNNMAKIVTMGEIMLRLSTPGNEKFIQADEFDINYGGSEANVAVSLANYGYDTEFVSAIPDNPIGDCAVAALRKYNVGTTFISRSGDRLGIYYLEPGSSVRPSNIVYDRAGSSIACAQAELFDFDAIFADADWFHAGTVRQRGQADRSGIKGSESTWPYRVCGFKLPQKALVPGKGSRGHDQPYAVCRCLHRQ